MSRELSFGQRLDAGQSMVECMDYYSLISKEYDRFLLPLQDIRKSKVKK